MTKRTLAEIAELAMSRGFRLVRVPGMTAEDLAVVRALDRTWARIRDLDHRVPQAVIEIGPGRESSCVSVGWDQPTIVLQFNLMPSGQKIDASGLLARLLHQAAHGVAFDPLLPPSTEGRYHSAAYARAAESLGLDVERSGQRLAGTGYSETSLAPGTRTRYRTELAALERALAKWEPTEQVKATRDSRNPVPFICSCDPPRRLRMNQAQADLGPVTCSICGEPFLPAS
jgi:hypothetical protein